MLPISWLYRGIGLRPYRSGIVGFGSSFTVFPTILPLVIRGYKCVADNRSGAFLTFDKRVLRWNLGWPGRRLRRVELRFRFRRGRGNRVILRYRLWYRCLRRHRILGKCPCNPQEHCEYACKVFHGPLCFSEKSYQYSGSDLH